MNVFKNIRNNKNLVIWNVSAQHYEIRAIGTDREIFKVLRKFNVQV